MNKIELHERMVKNAIDQLFEYGVPERLHQGFTLYLTHGYQPGGFLTSVLQNELFDAVGRCDDPTLRSLKACVTYVYNCVPLVCWGSPVKVAAWMREVRALRQPSEEEHEQDPENEHVEA